MMHDNNTTVKLLFDGKQLGLDLDNGVFINIPQPLNTVPVVTSIDQLRQAIHRSNMVIVHFDSLGGFSG